jgi:hypothetical protein
MSPFLHSYVFALLLSGLLRSIYFPSAIEPINFIFSIIYILVDYKIIATILYNQKIIYYTII